MERNKNMKLFEELNKELGTNFKEDREIDWETILDDYKLSIDLIEKYKKYFSGACWYIISTYYKLNEEFIIKHKSKIDWNSISRYQKLSEDFIEKYANKLNWYYLCKNQKLTEQIIEKFQNKMDWELISIYQNLSIDFIEKYLNNLSFRFIQDYQKLSKEFIEKYSDQINWEWISRSQLLSEDFIEKYQDKLDWYNISLFQKLSKNFINKFRDKIDFNLLKKNILIQSDIGRDWFVAYIDPIYINSIKDVFIFNNHLYSKNLKVKIYYKDLITTSKTKNFELIREICRYKIYGKNGII